MRLIVFGLTFLAAALFLYNFLGKKGTGWHIARGILVLLLSVFTAVANTVSASARRGLEWDFAFQAHFYLGVLFFAAIILAVLYGFMMKRAVLGSIEYASRKDLHRFFACASAVFFFASFVFAAILRFVR